MKMWIVGDYAPDPKNLGYSDDESWAIIVAESAEDALKLYNSDPYWRKGMVATEVPTDEPYKLIRVHDHTYDCSDF